MGRGSAVGRTAGGMAVAVSLALGGFAMSFAGPTPRGIADQRPGTCHLAEDPGELIVVASDTAPPVPCDRPHQTETMFLAEVTGVLAASPTRPNGELLNTVAGRLCLNDDRERSYLGGGPDDRLWNLDSWARFPTAAAWARGDRTVACQGSTPPSTPAGPTVSYPIAGVLSGPRSATFRLCRLGSAPLACDQPHTGEDPAPSAVLPAGPWPGPDKVTELARQTCLPIVDAYLGRPLDTRPDLVVAPDPVTEKGWDGGNRNTDCWLDNVNDHVTVGTVRGGLEQ